MADGEAKDVYGPLDDDLLDKIELCLKCGCVVATEVTHHCAKDLKLDVYNALSLYKVKKYKDHLILESILEKLDAELDQ